MAFTKAPTESTHNVRRFPPTVSPILVTATANNVAPTSGYINCFPLKEPQWGNDPAISVHKRDGWTSSTATGSVSSPATFKSYCIVQPVYQNYTYAYFGSNNNIYYLDYSSNTVSSSVSSGVSYGRGWGTNATDSSNVRKIAWLAGIGASSTLMLCNEDASGVTTTDLIALSLDGARGLVFINGYLFACNSSGSKIYNSNAAGVLTTWNSTNFIDAEQYADQILWIEKHHNYLVAFGEQSVEFFYDNAIEVGSPLARQESYSQRIGIYVGTTASGGCFVTRVGDDIYFLGKSETNNVSLYRIRNFKVEEIDSQYINGILNDPGEEFAAIYHVPINNNSHIVVETGESNQLAYFIDEDVWWRITGSDFPGQWQGMIGSPFVTIKTPAANYNTTPKTLAMDISGSTVTVRTPGSTSVTATYQSEPIDFGVNRWKHIARVDVIGDLSTNAITLSYNPSPNYGSSFVSCGSQTQSTIGYGNNMSWYNIGPARTVILNVAMVGTAPCIFRGLEIEYNMGVA